MIVDKGDHRLNGCPRSAWANYAAALRRISLACRSSRTSRYRALSFSAVSVGTPLRLPLSTSDFFTQATYLSAFGCRRLTSPALSSAFRLLSRVGEGDISALGCGLTGSCSSTFQRYSLGVHLGVTASPQSPLPAGYVTLPVDTGHRRLGSCPLTAEGKAFVQFLLSLLHSNIRLPDHPGRGAL